MRVHIFFSLCFVNTENRDDLRRWPFRVTFRTGRVVLVAVQRYFLVQNDVCTCKQPLPLLWTQDWPRNYRDSRVRIKIPLESREFSVKILISFCPFAARREHATRGTELNAVVSGSLGEKQRRGTSVIPMFPDVSSIYFRRYTDFYHRPVLR